ncbi:hypothetical protein ACGFXC_07675 [Streptomyces sp. NPDC048507]|uniref:hypothetical protein n=1 Tax=Streptomyces sp. NPDC048507 TaxID=3365560 RepID=UPI00371A83A9
MSTTVRPAPGRALLGAAPARAVTGGRSGGPSADPAPAGADTTVPVPIGGATAPAAGPGTAPAARRRGA